MPEFESNNEQSLIKSDIYNGEDNMEQDYVNDFRAQAFDDFQRMFKDTLDSFIGTKEVSGHPDPGSV